MTAALLLRPPRPTLAEQLAAGLAEQIVAGARPPGAALEEIHLAVECGTAPRHVPRDRGA